ncbi:MAG: flagellar biosynthetic protein FliR [Rhodospirillales bacterium]|jgi:flagellar biosynthetic protein FliR|nr:flagellar biosynthetic protein FliR [Rhodospirillales bacterium]MDP6805584.1 flagellar biosynthetic protein FliR [Rhodospirillales bacterium]
MLQQLLTLNLFGFFLVFARIGTAFVLLPGFSAGYVAPRMRLLMALAVSLVVTPVVAGMLPGLPATPAELSLMLLAEMTIGAFFGLMARFVVAALQVTGTIISLVSSMANAFIQDPLADQQSSVIAGFLSTLGVLLLFVTDLHHLMLRAVVDSYSLFTPGEPLMMGDMTQMVARRVADAFALGLQLASPLVVTGFAYYLGLGLLTRLMPQMPVFFVGLPIQVTIQISVLALALSGIMIVFLTRFQEGLTGFLVP